MGYAIATGRCIGCGQVFSYNPVRVPSLVIKGTREPVCRGCVERANPRRIKNGLPPIVPADDAYDPVDEAELG
jgi:hypothetical protein